MSTPTIASNTSSSAATTAAKAFFRCSACTSLIQRRISRSDFVALVEKRRRDQQQGQIIKMLKDKTSGENIWMNHHQDQQQEEDRSSFRTRNAPFNLCILPQGVDGLELVGARWGNTATISDGDDQQLHGLCSEGAPVTLLAAPTTEDNSQKSSSSSVLAELSSGPLLIDGLDRKAEILIQVKDTTTTASKDQQQQEEATFRYAQYHTFNSSHDAEFRQKELASKTSKTLFGGDGTSPVILHANPCPLTFDRYCQLAVTKKYKPMHPDSPTTPHQVDQQQHEVTSSVPVHSFVRKLAASTVVICRVPNQKQKTDNNNIKYDHYVLLTQRQPYMRTFPSFFVVPGGGFDAHDGTLENCAKRELMEEVALQFVDNDNDTCNNKNKDVESEQQHQGGGEAAAASTTLASTSTTSRSITTIGDGEWNWVGVWESSFCTHPDAPEVVDGSCTVRGHIVFFFSVVFDVPSVEDLPRLKPQSEEVASAKWYKYGPSVDDEVKNMNNDTDKKEEEEANQLFGSVPPITEYFEKMELDPQRIELTLKLEEELYGKKNKKRTNQNGENDEEKTEEETTATTSTSCQRMKITAGTEFFITRILEKMILKEQQN